MFLYKIANAFEAANIEYAIVGGHAVALHGAVRGTVDLDIILQFKQSQFEAAERTLKTLGLHPRLPLKAAEVFKFREEYIKNRNLVAWSFSNPQNPTEILDIIITHNLADMKVAEVRIGKTTLKIVSLEDLIEMKKESGRPQDLEDIKALKEIKK